MAHQARAYPGFCSMKRLGDLYSPLDGMQCLRLAIYTPGWRETLKVKCLVISPSTSYLVGLFDIFMLHHI